MYEPLPTFILRAPLLREAEWTRGGAALALHALGDAALALASGRLTAAADSAARRRALDRYGRRAAFRATPSGLLAGVCMGALGRATRIATGTPAAALAPTWARIASLGRALLDDDELRARVRLRVAPSLVRAATTVRWLAPAAPFAEERVADLDDRLAAILAVATPWTPWAKVRRAAGGDAHDADELLLLLVDDGLLRTDLGPPLVGPPPDAWMRARLSRLAAPTLAAALARACRTLARGDLPRGAARLAALPGAGPLDEPSVQGVLVHRPRRAPTLARAVVERAASLAPLLFRLQDALEPPANERLAQPSLDEALEAVTEIHGAGALDLAALAAGDYGVNVGAEGDDGVEGDARVDAAGAPPAVLALLVDALLAAARGGRASADLDVAALSAALGGVGPAPPPSCELFLSPMIARRGAREGTGWLLGLHAPAGASWGRFAAALGAPLARALQGLDAAERAANPADEVLDVSFAPSPAVADLCTHPRVRRRALALTEWPDDAGASDDALTPSDLELVADPGAAAPLALRARAGGAPVTPSPLARVRSTTAPPGTTRLLCGWGLFRQHAPWAVELGPLAALDHVPRLVLDGFVVAPASWRVPAALGAAPGRARLARWRRTAGVPRHVQVGHEDQLLVVDLASEGARADLADHERVWEIWPPLGASVDHDGRRVEAVVALVDRPDAEDAAAATRAARATRAAGRVPPPRVQPPPSDWRTFKVFGAREHQDDLLLQAILPAIAAARQARELSAWFFQRYVDGPGRRHHLRLRVRAPEPRAREAFAARLEAALTSARASGAVVAVETGDFHPERARFGGALAATHAIFQSDSELAGALLAEERRDGQARDDDDAPDRLAQVVRSLEALTRGLGLDLDARRAIARARRDAEENDAGPTGPDTRAATDAEFRARGRALRASLGAPSRSAAARALDAHAARTARAVKGLPAEARAALAPAWLHLACVRLAGPDRDLERRAYTFWERTLEGLRASARAPRRADARQE